MADSVEPARDDEPVVYETRFVPTNDADKILPFVLQSLQTIGCGSACVVRDGNAVKGIQLTAPVNFALLLVSTIEKLKALGAPKFRSNEFYAPLLYVMGSQGTMANLIEKLRIVPPDMCLSWIQIDDAKYAIAVSGPPDSGRKKIYTDHVLPSLTALVRSMELPGFPL
jgi:hypothetical protein